MGINSGTEPWAFSQHSLISSLLGSVLGPSIHTPQRGIVQDVGGHEPDSQLASGPKTLSISYGIDTASGILEETAAVYRTQNNHIIVPSLQALC